MPTDVVKAGNINFTNAAEAARLQLEAVEALGHYKLAIAQAELVAAYARNERAKAAAREAVVRQLHKALIQLDAQKSLMRRQIRQWQRLARQIAFIQDGQQINRVGLNQMWQAYTIYQRLVTADVSHEIEDSPIDSSERSQRNYVMITSNGKRDLQHDVPGDVNNLAALIAWLQEQRRVIPKRGTRVFQLVRDAFLAIAGKRAAEEIELLRKLMAAIETQTLDAWQPLMIAPFLDNAAISKLVDVRP